MIVLLAEQVDVTGEHTRSGAMSPIFRSKFSLSTLNRCVVILEKKWLVALLND
jgi:hypothetical protein